MRILGWQYRRIQSGFVAASIWHIFVFLTFENFFIGRNLTRTRPCNTSISRSTYHKFNCSLCFLFCSVRIYRQNNRMRICPARIIIKQFGPWLCGEIQIFRFLKSARSPSSSHIESCFSTLEEFLMIVDTFRNISVIIQRLYKLCCFHCDIFIHCNLCTFIIYKRCSSHLEIRRPPYTIWVITIIGKRNHRLSVSHNRFTFVKDSKKIIFAVNIQFSLFIQRYACFFQNIFIIVKNFCMGIQRDRVYFSIKGYRFQRIFPIHRCQINI